MVQITEENRPLCAKCEQPAICYFSKIWLCGDCVTKYVKKMEEQHRAAILEE